MPKFSFQFNSKPGEPALLTWIHAEGTNKEDAYLLACAAFVEQRYEVTVERETVGPSEAEALARGWF